MHRSALFTSLALAGLLVAFHGTAHVSAAETALDRAIAAPSDGPSATPDASPNATDSPTYVQASSVTTASPTPSPTDSPTGSPSPSPSSSPASRHRGRATPSPSPSPSPSDTPPPDGTTPIPTQPPTPKPIAPNQATVPDSMSDPNVKGILGRPIPQMSQFSWMIGTWRAHNVEQLGDGRQVDLGINTYVFASTMKDRWIFGGDGKATDYFYITFDPFAQHFVFVRVNPNPAYGIWVSATGWHQNTISFTSNYSYVNGRQYRRRLTIIRKDARTFGIYDEEQLSNGSWTADDAVELTRTQ